MPVGAVRRHAAAGATTASCSTPRTAAYGTPDDLKALVDAAHGAGLMVFLDVVYNHFGPDGNYLAAYAPEFFHPERQTPWGARDRLRARRRSGASSSTTRSTGSDEFRFDGLRLDAVDHVHDPDSDVGDPGRDRPRPCAPAFPDRPIHLTTEDNRNITRLHERGPGRRGAALHRRVERRLPQRRPRRSPPARPRATTPTSPRTTGPSSPARWPRASPTRASRRPTPAARRAACPAATCRRSPSSTSCRTTTRSATAPSASG